MSPIAVDNHKRSFSLSYLIKYGMCSIITYKRFNYLRIAKYCKYLLSKVSKEYLTQKFVRINGRQKNSLVELLELRWESSFKLFISPKLTFIRILFFSTNLPSVGEVSKILKTTLSLTVVRIIQKLPSFNLITPIERKSLIIIPCFYLLLYGEEEHLNASWIIKF